jgi:hypothetical protein
MRLRILPTPKYARIVKRVREIDVIRPRRELAKIREEVNSNAANKPTKNMGIAAKVSGATE